MNQSDNVYNEEQWKVTKPVNTLKSNYKLLSNVQEDIMFQGM